MNIHKKQTEILESDKKLKLNENRLKYRIKKLKVIGDEEILQAWDKVDESINKISCGDYKKSDHHKPDTYDYQILQAQLESCECEAEEQLKAKDKRIEDLEIELSMANGCVDSLRGGLKESETQLNQLRLEFKALEAEYLKQIQQIGAEFEKAELRKVKEEIEEQTRYSPGVHIYDDDWDEYWDKKLGKVGEKPADLKGKGIE